MHGHGSECSLTSIARDYWLDKLEWDFKDLRVAVKSDLDCILDEMRTDRTKQAQLLQDLVSQMMPRVVQPEQMGPIQAALPHSNLLQSESPPIEVPPNLIVDSARANQLTQMQNNPWLRVPVITGVRNASTPILPVYCTQSQGHMNVGMGRSNAQAEVHMDRSQFPPRGTA